MGDFHLQDFSRCIRAADPAPPFPDDLEGISRPQPPPPGCTLADIGAYENEHCTPLIPIPTLVIRPGWPLGGRSTNVVLYWTKVDTSYSYTIYGSSEPFIAGDSLDTVSDTTWTDTNVSSRPSPYFYYVTTVE